MAATTTHASRGEGHPRLVVSASGPPLGVPPDSKEREHPLRPDVTTIGSDPSCDIALNGLDALQVRVVRDVADEFCVHPASGGPTSIDGVRAHGQPIHTGDRLQVGPWTLLFVRDEFADHGRPYGGRQGGEGSHQRPQPPRRIDPTGVANPREA